MAAVTDDGFTQHLLVLKQLLKLLALSQIGDKRDRILVLCITVQHAIDTAHATHDALKLALAHPLLFKVDKLELDTALFKVALGLLGIEALLGAEDLDIHMHPPSGLRQSVPTKKTPEPQRTIRAMRGNGRLWSSGVIGTRKSS